MGNARFLYTNLATALNLTVSSERAGIVGLPVKVGSGSAALQAQGTYTGPSPTQYVIQIDGVAGGTGIGQATFCWKRSTDSAWRASTVLTSAALLTLEYGVKIQWVAGTGTNFVLGDYWTLICDKPFGALMLFDRDRDTEWRSADVASAITLDIDLGSAQQVDAIALLDHNLSAGATLAILGNSSPSWSSPPVNEAITRQAANLVYYLVTASRSYRYWRIVLTDAGNADGYLRASELFLGGYVGLSGNFDRGWSRTQRAELFGGSSALRSPRGIWSTAERIDVQYNLMTAADQAAIAALWAATYSQTLGTTMPFLCNFDSAVPADVSLFEWDQGSWAYQSPFLGRFNWPLAMVQRPRLARSGS